MGRLNAVEPRLPVADLERSFRFYAETLGFEAMALKSPQAL